MMILMDPKLFLGFGLLIRQITFLLFSGIFLIILGYFIMAYGEVNSFQSLTLAPIILFIGYIILIPSALIYKERIINKD